MPIATVTSLAPNGTWSGSQGLMYSFNVGFNDGNFGEANAKSQTPPYRIGDSVEYTITGQSPKGTPKVKVQKPKTAGAPQQAQGSTPGGFNQPVHTIYPTHNQNASNASGTPKPEPAAVGMALKLAGDFMIADRMSGVKLFDRQLLWHLASEILRVGYMLNQGNFAPKPSPKGEEDFDPQPMPTQRPQPGPDNSVALPTEDIDCPF